MSVRSRPNRQAPLRPIRARNPEDAGAPTGLGHHPAGMNGSEVTEMQPADPANFSPVAETQEIPAQQPFRYRPDRRLRAVLEGHGTRSS